MANQNNVSNVFLNCETVDTNLRLIESLSWLVICADEVRDDANALADVMQVIIKLKDEAKQSNDALLKAIKGSES